MNNIIDSIRLSGTTYQIQGSGGGGTQAIELTQAQYDALVDKDPNVFYIITDAEAGDLTNYYTKTETDTLLDGKADTATTYTKTEVDTALASKADTATTYTKQEVDNAITAATSTKQDTLVSSQNIKTINNESILGSGNIDIQGGGGKAIEAGRGISITTGETADTVSFNLAIYDRGKTSVSECHGENSNVPICSSNFCHLEQPSGSIGSNSNSSHKEGAGSKIGNNSNNSHVEGFNCEVGTNSPFSHAEGQYTKTSNQSEHASGQYNASSRASITFGDSGNTLFSVGNGTANLARHNAFEIRQNGDIYLTLDGQDVKLQDHLGGGGSDINVVQTTGTSTTDVMSQNAVTTKLNTKLDVVRVDPKTPTSNYTQLNLYLEKNGSGGQSLFTYVKTINGKSITSQNNDNLEGFSLIETSAITTSISSSSTDAQVPSAKAVNDKLGGLSLVKLTQAEYDALSPNYDSNTLYVIVN